MQRTLRTLAFSTAVLATVAVLLLLFGERVATLSFLPRAHAIARTAVQTGAAGLVLGTALLSLSGACACLARLHARSAAPPERTPPATRSARGRAAGRIGRGVADGLSGLTAPRVVVPVLAGAAAVLAWWLRPTPGAPASADALIVAATLLVAGFLALLAERTAAAIRPALLPEAAALRALLLPPALLLPIGAGVAVAVAFGRDWALWAGTAAALVLASIAAEVAFRALGRWFLPATHIAHARAPVDSLLAAMLAGAVGRAGRAAPTRAQFGIDFSRSWALGYLRAAAAPALLLTALFCWGLTGVVAIPIDQRGIYERFGAPVAVLQPGLHAVLPWPLGQVRRVEFDVVHEIPLGAELAAAVPVAAEAPAPASADRLWDRPHPGEVAFLIASPSGVGEGDARRQGFQVVDADIRVLYRVGLDDADARRAAYSVADPDTLVRGAANRLLSRYFAARTLDAVLGARREAMADALRRGLAAALAPFDSGIEIVDVVVEAIHPPSGAAASYRAVEAAAIEAQSSVATETGRARATANQARQNAQAIVDAAQARAAETIDAARADTVRFDTDRAAATAGGRAFLLERYFANLSTAFARAPLTIVDNRLDARTAPILDLRPFAGAAAASTGDPD